jgi:hypothetical protein
MRMKRKNRLRGIIATKIEFGEDRSSNCTRLRSDLVDLSPSRRTKNYACIVTFRHRRKANRCSYGGWKARKASVEFELYVCGMGRRNNTKWTMRSDVPLKHRKVWDFMENSASVIWEKNKWILSLWSESKNQKTEE